MILIIWNILRPYGAAYVISRNCFCAYLRRIYILLSWEDCLYVNYVKLVDNCVLVFYILIDFMSVSSSKYWKRSSESTNSNCEYHYFPFHFVLSSFLYVKIYCLCSGIIYPFIITKFPFLLLERFLYILYLHLTWIFPFQLS